MALKPKKKVDKETPWEKEGKKSCPAGSKAFLYSNNTYTTENYTSNKALPIDIIGLTEEEK